MSLGLGWRSWAFFSASAASRYLPELYRRSPSFTSAAAFFAPFWAHAGKGALATSARDNRKASLMASQPTAELAALETSGSLVAQPRDQELALEHEGLGRLGAQLLVEDLLALDLALPLVGLDGGG